MQEENSDRKGSIHEDGRKRDGSYFWSSGTRKTEQGPFRQDRQTCGIVYTHLGPPDRRNEAQADLRLARAAAIHFQFVANQTRFVLARDALANPSNTLSPEEAHRLRVEIKRCLEFEIVLARQLFTLAREDSRIGFEPSCQYFYLPLDLVEKVVNCRWLLEYFED